ncbi:MAG: PHP domain-containing protein [bacterium]|nr:PHP domain-containing protein [bacterium]
MPPERCPITADLHTHNLFSHKDSPASPAEVVRACHKRNLQGIAVTNHNTIEGTAQTKEAARSLGVPLLVIAGEEITTAKLNPAGKRVEVLALFLQEAIPPNLSVDQTLEEIKKQDALVAIPHPFELWRHGAGPEIAIEIIRRAQEMGIPVLWEVFNSRSSFKNNRLACDFLRGAGEGFADKLLLMVGSDAHHPGEVGRARLHLERWENKEDLLQKLPTGKRLASACEGYNEIYVTLFYRALNKLLLAYKQSNH